MKPHLALALLTLAATANAADSYRTYANARFGTVAAYPSNLLAPRPESANRDGRRFVSRDGTTVLTVSAINNVLNQTLLQRLNEDTKTWKTRKARVTYAKPGPQWFAISGYVGADIFYQKTVLWKDAFHTMLWRYRASQRRRLDAAVIKTTRAFAARNFVAPVVVSAPRTAPRSQKKEQPPKVARPRAVEGY